MAQATRTGKELTITRVFNAPREAVWKAWTDPRQMMSWWGPRGYTSPFCKIDLRIGGKVLSSMKGPDGKEIWGTGVYREIVPSRKLVVTDSFSDEKGNVVPATHYGMSKDFPLELEIAVTFEDENGKTRMVLKHSGFPEGETFGAETGWNESFDKLAEYLAGGAAGKLKFGSIMIGSAQPKALAEFYEKVFGKPADWSEDSWFGWQVGNTQFTIGEHSEVKGKTKEPQRVILNFEAVEVKEEARRIKGLGAMVVKDLYELEGAWIATFADPDGNYFQIIPPWDMNKEK